MFLFRVQSCNYKEQYVIFSNNANLSQYNDYCSFKKRKLNSVFSLTNGGMWKTFYNFAVPQDLFLC